MTSVTMDSRSATSLTLSWAVPPRQRSHVKKYEVTYKKKVWMAPACPLLLWPASCWLPSTLGLSAKGETEPRGFVSPHFAEG